ncbi:MAG TPA: hypothetical protein VIZ17_07960 [Acetobacteraceae bacterium]
MLRYVIIVLVALGVVPGVAAGWSEHWTATSNTAISITGDVTLYSDRMALAGGKTLPIHKVRNLPIADPAGFKGLATLYRVAPPADPVLLRGNRICGTGAVTFVVIWHSAPMAAGDRPGRAFAAFTGQAEPAGLGGACATFYYSYGA